MKKETTHFILGILLGLLLASLLSHSSLQLPNVSRWLQSLFPVAIFATAADSPIKEEGFQEVTHSVFSWLFSNLSFRILFLRRSRPSHPKHNQAGAKV